MGIDFIGIGAPKSGTTWLATILREHPEVFMPEGEELSYFNDKVPYFECIFHNRPKGIEWYEKQFVSAHSNQTIGEFSNVYMYDSKTVNRIKEFESKVKLIVSLRNPIEMIYSQFWYMKSSVSCRLQASSPDDLFTNPEYKNFLAMGKFAAHLRPFFQVFRRDNIHVVLFDDLVASPEKTAQALYSFVGVDPTYLPASLKKKINEARVSKSEMFKNICCAGLAGLQNIGLNSIAESIVKSKMLAGIYGKINYSKGYPRISPVLRDKLHAYYAEDIIELKRLIGRTVDWA